MNPLADCILRATMADGPLNAAPAGWTRQALEVSYWCSEEGGDQLVWKCLKTGTFYQSKPEFLVAAASFGVLRPGGSAVQPGPGYHAAGMFDVRRNPGGPGNLIRFPKALSAQELHDNYRTCLHPHHPDGNPLLVEELKYDYWQALNTMDGTTKVVVVAVAKGVSVVMTGAWEDRAKRVWRTCGRPVHLDGEKERPFGRFGVE